MLEPERRWENMKSRIFIMVVLVVVASVVSVSAEDKATSRSAEKRADIRRMMELTGAGKIGTQFMDQLITIFKQGKSGVSDKFWEDFQAEVDANELVEMVIPIYEKYLTHDEIRGLIKFYESPVGKKLIEVQPKIMQESMMAGQKWGQQLGEKIANKLREQGYK